MQSTVVCITRPTLAPTTPLSLKQLPRQQSKSKGCATWYAPNFTNDSNFSVTIICALTLRQINHQSTSQHTKKCFQLWQWQNNFTFVPLLKIDHSTTIKVLLNCVAVVTESLNGSHTRFSGKISHPPEFSKSTQALHIVNQLCDRGMVLEHINLMKKSFTFLSFCFVCFNKWRMSAARTC